MHSGVDLDRRPEQREFSDLTAIRLAESIASRFDDVRSAWKFREVDIQDVKKKLNVEFGRRCVKPDQIDSGSNAAAELGKKSDQSRKKDWIHEPGETPPPEFHVEGHPCGPVEGNEAELDYGFRPESSKDVSDVTLRKHLQKLASGDHPKIWIRSTKTRTLEAFFRSNEDRKRAKAGVDEHKSKKVHESSGN